MTTAPPKHPALAQRFTATHPRSMALAEQAAQHFLFGVPLHWMRDWPSPTSLCVQQAQGAQLLCADGQSYSDFCLGDTGAMFGHSPAPVAQAIAEQAGRGLTCMLPSVQTAEVGQLLATTFGLPQWQMALTASDANRFLLRWASATAPCWRWTKPIPCPLAAVATPKCTAWRRTCWSSAKPWPAACPARSTVLPTRWPSACAMPSRPRPRAIAASAPPWPAMR